MPGETLLEDAELRSTTIRQGRKRLRLYSMRGWTEYSAAVRLHLPVEVLVDSVSSKDAQPAQHPSRAYLPVLRPLEFTKLWSFRRMYRVSKLSQITTIF